MNRKIILFTAVSIDNYIATNNHEIHWLHRPEFQIEDEDYGYEEFFQTIDTTLMGHNTYQVTKGFEGEFPYKEKTNYVFRFDKSGKEDPHVDFISGDILEFTKNLKSQEGKDIWLIGGGQVNALMFKAGLIDEIILTRIPIVLGQGIPLFDGKLPETILSLESTKSWDNGIIQAKYYPKLEA